MTITNFKSRVLVAHELSPAAPAYFATSGSGASFGTGEKTLATQIGTAFRVGQRVRMISRSSPTEWQEGEITSYTAGIMVVDVDFVAPGASGTASDWDIVTTGVRGAVDLAGGIFNGPIVLEIGGTTGPDENILLTINTASGKRGIAINHYASEVGQYALDIHCFKNSGADANSAIAVHNYSADNPAVIIDSTDQQTILALNNSENPVTSPGTRGSGPFISFSGYAGLEPTTRRNLGFLGGSLAFVHNYDDVMWTFATGLAINGPVTLTKPALQITAVNDSYAAQIQGLKSGAFVSTTDNDGNTFALVKNGAGAGTVAFISNGGTGDTLLLTDGVYQPVFRVDYLGHLAIPNMLTAAPGGGGGYLWADPADSYTVKFAA